jgi:small subunit ribosomal protein S6
VYALRDYEIVYVIRPDLADGERSEKASRIHAMIEEAGGELGEVEDWGTRVLAYEIRHYNEGHYGLATFRLPPQSVKPVKDRLNIDEDILRYQIVLRTP